MSTLGGLYTDGNENDTGQRRRWTTHDEQSIIV